MFVVGGEDIGNPEPAHLPQSVEDTKMIGRDVKPFIFKTELSGIVPTRLEAVHRDSPFLPMSKGKKKANNKYVKRKFWVFRIPGCTK